MSWSRLQSNGEAHDRGLGPTAVAYTSSLTAGSKLIAATIVFQGTTTGVADNNSNSFTKLASVGLNNDIAGSGELALWALDTPAGDVGTKPTITATPSGSGQPPAAIVIQEVSGLLAGNTSSMLDGAAGTSFGQTVSSGNVSCGTYGSTAASEYLVAIYGDDENAGNTAGTPTGSATYTLDANSQQNNGVGLIAFAYGNSTNGTETATFNISNGGATSQYGTLLVAFKLPGGGAAAQPDVPSIAPGLTWFDLFKPGMRRPRPFISVPVSAATESGALAVPLPVPATALSGLDTLPLDQLQAQPGPVWLDLFKSGLRRQRPVPPAFAPAAEQGSFSITLPLPSLSLTGLDTLPSDQPQAQPGSTWLDLFKPWVQRPRPVPPSFEPPGEQGTFSITLPVPATTLSGLDTLTTDQPGISPGATWLDTFKAGLRRPRPVTAQTYAVGGEQGTLGIVLPVPSAAVSGLDTLTTDQPQAQPGPAWLAWLKPGLRKPKPPLPAQPPPGTSTEAGAFLVVLPPGQRDQNETGDFTQLLPVPVLSLAGAVAHDGSLAVSLPVPSTSLSAATNSGPFAATLPSPVLSLTSVKGHAGGLAVPLPVPVLSLTGHAKMAWTGALAVTVPVPQTTLAGADGHAGFLNISFAVPPPHMTWHEFLASGLAPRSVQLSRFEMFGAQSLAEAGVTLPLPALSLAAKVPDPPGWRTVFRAGRWISARLPRRDN